MKNFKKTFLLISFFIFPVSLDCSDIFEYEMDCEEICYKVSIRGRIFLFTDLELEIINAPKK